MCTSLLSRSRNSRNSGGLSWALSASCCGRLPFEYVSATFRCSASRVGGGCGECRYLSFDPVLLLLVFAFAWCSVLGHCRHEGRGHVSTLDTAHATASAVSVCLSIHGPPLFFSKLPLPFSLLRATAVDGSKSRVNQLQLLNVRHHQQRHHYHYRGQPHQQQHTR